MDKMRDFRRMIDSKLNVKHDRNQDASLSLPYNPSDTISTVNITRDLCSELKRIGDLGLVTASISGDKKNKKKGLEALSNLFREASEKCPPNDALRGPLLNCEESFTNILQLSETFREDLKSTLLIPLEDVEETCLEIIDMHKKLQILNRDLSSLKEKLIKAEDQQNNTATIDETRINQIRTQISEAENERDSMSDSYLLKVFQFQSSEFDHATILQELLLHRKMFHDKCLSYLKDAINKCNQIMECNRKPVSFRTPLENHLRETKRTIAYPIEHCVQSLCNETNLRQEGLFRVSGSKTRSDLLCEVLNVMQFDKMNYEWSANVLADGLKRYLREMPVQLLGKIPRKDWSSCFEMYQKGHQKESLWKINELLTEKMPEAYLLNIQYLIRFLHRVVAEQKYNKMNVQNICTVFVPNLFHSDSAVVGSENSECNRFILENLLMHTDFFFPHSNITFVEERKKKKAPRRPDTCSVIENNENGKPDINRAERCHAMYSIIPENNSNNDIISASMINSSPPSSATSPVSSATSPASSITSPFNKTSFNLVDRQPLPPKPRIKKE